MKNAIQNIAVIGDGGWGTTLAVHLAKKNFSVSLWGPFPGYINLVKKNRYNPKFLPGIKIPNNVNIGDQLLKPIQESDLIVFAIPSKYALSVLKKIKGKNIDFENKIFLSVVKGLDTSRLLRVSEIVEEQLGNIPFAVLSGPTIAIEVARGLPSTAVIASPDNKIAQSLQEVFNSEKFRIYTNSDVTGVELGGSIKNIIALACGVCDGLGFGSNTKAAILTRGLAEMARLGKAFGASPKTFSGLSGLGDLVTTCFSPISRNRSVGEQLGQGKSITKILSSMEMVAEGVETVKAAYQLSQKHEIAMPITTEIHNIIYKKKKPLQAVSDLMTRQIKSE